MFKQEKGITLVSLVITIIIMLILAGVSLSMVMGDGSLLDQANSAVSETELGTVKDEISMAIAGAQANYYATFANTTRSTLETELKNLKMREFMSATAVAVETGITTGVSTGVDTAATSANACMYYKIQSTGEMYIAPLEITTTTIKVLSVSKASSAITDMPSAAKNGGTSFVTLGN